MKTQAAPVLEQDITHCFFLFRNEEEEGPFTFQQLKDLHDSGEVSPTTPCRARSGKEWHDLAFLLRRNTALPTAEGIFTLTPAPEHPDSAGSGDLPLRQMVGNLMESSEQQVRILTSIKWCLLILIVMTAGVILASR